MSEASERDRLTIGTTDAGEESLAVLIGREWFDVDVAAFRVAVAYAIAKDLAPTHNASFKTKWSTSGVDPDGRLRDLIGMFVSSERPYDLAQQLGDAGLAALADGARSGKSLAELIIPE